MQDELSRENYVLEENHAELEKHLIAEYLKKHGYTQESLSKLPEAQSRKLLNEASIYASGKLAEIEDRARFTTGLRETGRDLK